MSRETRMLDPKEIAQVEVLAGYGLKVEQIASVLGMSKATFDRRQADQPELREALSKGRARGSAAVLQALYKMATSGKHVAATIFWVKVREGWKEDDFGADERGALQLAYAKKPGKGDA